MADAVLVAHNGRFDVAFIEASTAGGHEISCQWLCTLEFAASLDYSASRSLRA